MRWPPKETNAAISKERKVDGGLFAVGAFLNVVGYLVVFIKALQGGNAPPQ
jgi:hypothetical protein